MPEEEVDDPDPDPGYGTGGAMVMTVAALILPADPYPIGPEADDVGSFTLAPALVLVLVLMSRFWSRCLSISSQNTSSGVASESTDSYHRFKSSAACLDCCLLFDPEPEPAADPLDRLALSRVLDVLGLHEGADGFNLCKGADCVAYLRSVADAGV